MNLVGPERPLAAKAAAALAVPLVPGMPADKQRHARCQMPSPVFGAELVSPPALPFLCSLCQCHTSAGSSSDHNAKYKYKSRG